MTDNGTQTDEQTLPTRPEAGTADEAAPPQGGASREEALEQMAERNLERALIDFEVANARVIDLTRRLTAMTAELLSVREELEEMRLRLSRVEAEKAAVEAEYGLVRATISYRGMRAVGAVLHGLKRTAS